MHWRMLQTSEGTCPTGPLIHSVPEAVRRGLDWNAAVSAVVLQLSAAVLSCWQLQYVHLCKVESHAKTNSNSIMTVYHRHIHLLLWKRAPSENHYCAVTQTAQQKTKHSGAAILAVQRSVCKCALKNPTMAWLIHSRAGTASLVHFTLMFRGF